MIDIKCKMATPDTLEIWEHPMVYYRRCKHTQVLASSTPSTNLQDITIISANSRTSSNHNNAHHLPKHNHKDITIRNADETIHFNSKRKAVNSESRNPFKKVLPTRNYSGLSAVNKKEKPQTNKKYFWRNLVRKYQQARGKFPPSHHQPHGILTAGVVVKNADHIQPSSIGRTDGWKITKKHQRTQSTLRTNHKLSSISRIKKKRQKAVPAHPHGSSIEVPISEPDTRTSFGRVATRVPHNSQNSRRVVLSFDSIRKRFTRHRQKHFKCALPRRVQVELFVKAVTAGTFWSTLFTLIYWAVGMALFGWWLWMFFLQCFCLCHGEISHFVKYGNVSCTPLNHCSKDGFVGNLTVTTERIDYDGNVSIGGVYTPKLAVPTGSPITLHNYSEVSLVHNATTDNMTANLVHGKNITHNATFKNDTEDFNDAATPSEPNNLTSCSFVSNKPCKSCCMTDFLWMTFFGITITCGSFGYFAIWITKCYGFTKEDYRRLSGMKNVNLAKEIRNIEKLPCVREITCDSHNHPVTLLTKNTWVYKERIGKDAKALKHNSIEIKHIFRVMNEKLMAQYTKARRKSTTPVIPELPQELAEKPILTTEVCVERPDKHDEMDNLLSCKELSLEPGEVYLFHGTKLENIPSILKHGFDLSRARSGLYGRAIYLAESSEKADQYTDYHSNRRCSNLAMLVVKVTLGRILYHPEERKFKMPYTRSHLLFTKAKHDTVMAGINKRFREFLIFDEKKIYPEFVVIYDRIK